MKQNVYIKLFLITIFVLFTGTIYFAIFNPFSKTQSNSSSVSSQTDNNSSISALSNFLTKTRTAGPIPTNNPQKTIPQYQAGPNAINPTTVPAPKPELKNLAIKQETPTKYSLKSLNNDTIELGTEKTPSQKPVSKINLPFLRAAYASQDATAKPYLKLNKWDGEASLKITIPFEVTSEQPEIVGDKLKYNAGKTSIEFLAKAPEEITEKDSEGNEHKYTINEEGGVEFNTVLNIKPSTNSLDFPIDTTNLDFFYQPPLNEENKDPNLACTATECKDKDGNIVNFRPENVVGSYAVYYKDNKSGDFSQKGGKNYKAGKAFHIYRPKIWDASGKAIWGELKLDKDKQLLSVIIPQDYLNSAQYPITIDPNFGYETPGGTLIGAPGTGIVGSLFTGAVGTVSSLSVYSSQSGPPIYGSAYFKGILVLHNDLSIITNGIGSEVTLPNGATAAWRSTTISSASISPVDYVLSILSKSNLSIVVLYYDSGSSNQGHTQGVGANNYTTPTNPTDFTHNTNKYSIYATYTVVMPTLDFSGVNMSGLCVGDAACPTSTPAPTPTPTPPPCFVGSTLISMADGSYKQIKDIKIGDKIKSYEQSNSQLTADTVTQIFYHSPEQMGDYYLEVATNNGKMIGVTPNHLIFINNQWQEAEKLSIGDILISDQNQKIQVTSITKIYKHVPVYNLEVNNHHVYFTNFLVHNKPG